MTSRALVLLLLACGSATALAQSLPQPGFDTRLLALAPATDKAQSCWLRRYDAKHLAAHPLQRVEAVGFCAEVERIAADPDVKGEIPRIRYNFRFAAKLKGRAAVARTSGECGWAYRPADQPAPAGAALHCGVECDGGGIDVEVRKAGAEMLIRLDRIRVVAGCGGDEDDESKAFDLTGGKDDKVFLLPKASVAAYRAFAGKPRD